MMNATVANSNLIEETQCGQQKMDPVFEVYIIAASKILYFLVHDLAN